MHALFVFNDLFDNIMYMPDQFSFTKISSRSPAHFLVLFAVMVFLACSAEANDIPWHLGTVGKSSKAPSAIQTDGVKPGPHPVVVAVIDSGIISQHPSLGAQVLPGFDMLSGVRNLRGTRTSDVTPDFSATRCKGAIFTRAQRTHGTEVASVIAGNGDGGVYGVNPKAHILPVRAFGACGMSRSDLLDAIAWAAGLPVAGVPTNPNPARIINLSLAGGGFTCSRELQTLIDQVVAMRVFVVAAAGNNFRKPLSEPANCRSVISVGSLDTKNRITNYSALDPRITIYAPGGTEGLFGSNEDNKLRVATYEDDSYGLERPRALNRGVGTSYAASLVSGFISLWLSHQPHKVPEDFRTELVTFVRDVKAIPGCPDCQPKGLAVNARIFDN